MKSNEMRRVAVIGGVRTPFVRSNTSYQDLSNQDLMTTALNGLVEKFHLEGQHIDEVVGGAVVTHTKDFNLPRESVIGTKLAPTTPGITLSQACGTSLQAALGSAAKIATGQIESAIAVGSDTISDAPIVFGRKFSHRLAKVSRGRSTGEKVKTFFAGFSPSELTPNAPSVNEPRTGLSMGQHTELMAQEFDIPRAEQDKLAYDSHKNAAKAYNEGFMDDMLVPTAGVFRDNNLREDIDLGKIGTLKTAFEKSERGTLTAANSTPLTDGASAVLLASEEWAEKHGLKPQAFLTYGAHAALDFINGQGLLMAPTVAVSKLLDQAGITLQDFDFYEIHEAFAAQVLATLKAWEDPKYCKEVLGKDKPLDSIDRSKLNVKGSSIAFGHPFAATGGRIIANLAKILEENGGGRGLISICTAGGMGVAAILERPRDQVTKIMDEAKIVAAEEIRTPDADMPIPPSVPEEAPQPAAMHSVAETADEVPQPAAMHRVAETADEAPQPAAMHSFAEAADEAPQPAAMLGVAETTDEAPQQPMGAPLMSH